MFSSFSAFCSRAIAKALTFRSRLGGGGKPCGRAGRAAMRWGAGQPRGQNLGSLGAGETKASAGFPVQLIAILLATHNCPTSPPLVLVLPVGAEDLQ